MMTDLNAWQMVTECERELALRRAARLGPLGSPAPPTRVPASRSPHRPPSAGRRFRPVLRIIGLAWR